MAPIISTYIVELMQTFKKAVDVRAYEDPYRFCMVLDYCLLSEDSNGVLGMRQQESNQ